MSNEKTKAPIDGIGLVTDVNRFQALMRNEMASLPPSPAKEMIECAFTALVPLLANLARDYPLMISAFQKQRETIESKVDQAKKNVDQARSNMAKLQPIEQIKKNITPLAAELPAGIAAQYGEEMRSRYLATPIVDMTNPNESAAWHDWSMT